MHLLVHVGYLLAVVYGVLGLFVLRLARKPNCRVCLLRGHCPNRLRGAAQIGGLPRCARRTKTGDSIA